MKETPQFRILMAMTVLGGLPLILVPVALIMALISGPLFFFGTLAYPLLCGILWWRSWAGLRAGRPVLAFVLAAPPALVGATGIGLYVFSMATAFQRVPTRGPVAGSEIPSPPPTSSASTLDAFQKVLQPAPADAEYTLAQSLLRGGRPAEAIPHFKKISALEPTNPGAVIDVGIALQEAGRQGEALEQFKQAARMPPNGLNPKGLAHYNVGVALENLNRPQEALEAYRKAVELSPDYADAQDSLASALLGESRYDEAVAHYRKLAALEPSKARAFRGIGLASYGAGRCPESMAAYARALQLCKTCLEPNEAATYAICKEKAAP